jgi:hypothetical protein
VEVRAEFNCIIARLVAEERRISQESRSTGVEQRSAATRRYETFKSELRFINIYAQDRENMTKSVIVVYLNTGLS